MYGYIVLLYRCLIHYTYDTMRRFSIKKIGWLTGSHVLERSIASLLFYSLIIFLVRFGDAIMGYFSPVYISEHIGSPMLMGVIISSSSIVGLLCDLFFGEWFRDWGYDTYLMWGIFGAILFPICFILLPPWVTVFILAMIIWGIYFECILFSNFHFVNHFLRHDQHALGWGVLYAFIAAAYMLAPFVASSLLAVHNMLPLYAALGAVLLGLIGISLFRRSHRIASKEMPASHKSLMHEVRMWRLLAKKIWPVLIFVGTLTIVDSVFWTSGAVLSESMRELGYPGGILFVVYLFPSLLMGSVAGKIASLFGKKKIAFISGIVAGLLFVIAGRLSDLTYMLLTIFVGSLFIAVAVPEINATIEDYIERLGSSANDMIGLENAITSASFIIGPLLAGASATLVNHQFSFSVVGGMLALVSIGALIVTPRKIRMPQKEIQLLG